MFMLLIIPMILFFTAESILWKKNRKTHLETLLGTTLWSLVTVLVVFLFSLIFEETPFINITWTIIGLTFLQVSFVICNVLLWVEIMKCMPISIAEPVALFRVVLLTVASWAVFGGELGAAKLILVSAIFLSCIGISFFQGKYKKRNIDANFARGLMYLFFWVITSVVINLVTQKTMRSGVRPITHATVQIALMFVLCLVIFLILKPGYLKTSIVNSAKDKVHIGIGISGVLARVCFSAILSIFSFNVGILTAIQMAVVALVVVYSIAFFKERTNPLVYFFITVTIGCSVALSLI